MQIGHAIVAVIVTVGGLAFLTAAALTNGQRVETEPQQHGVIPTALQYCTECLRLETAVTHPDGTTTCQHCGTHHPATEEAL